MRPVLKVMLRWALSPVATILNTGLLATLLLVRGVEPGSALFWLPVAIFFGAAAAAYDINAYVVQRRKGLTSEQVSDAVFERLWSSPPEEKEEEA